MDNQNIQIVDVRSLNETLYDTIDITGYDSDELPASVALKQSHPKRRVFTKPALSLTALISLAFKNSEFRRLTELQVYRFITRHFPYYTTANNSWKSCVRYTLGMSPYFMRWMPCKNGTSTQSGARSEKGLTWAVNPSMLVRIEELIARQSPAALRSARTCTYREADMKLLLAGRIAEKQDESAGEVALEYESAETECDSAEEMAETEEVEVAEVAQPKPLVFTQYMDGLFPLITLYAETPGDYKDVADKYPVKF